MKESYQTLKKVVSGLTAGALFTLNLGSAYANEPIKKDKGIHPSKLARKVLEHNPKTITITREGKVYRINEFPRLNREIPQGIPISGVVIKIDRIEYKDKNPKGPSEGDELTYGVTRTSSHSGVEKLVFKDKLHKDGEYTPWGKGSRMWQNNAVIFGGNNRLFQSLFRTLVYGFLEIEQKGIKPKK
jgi:hypothetical protein|tara:strand:+ start:3121 stop:3678 length:558 start_codon:yes stop_codon:yes gene_type:complete